MSRHPLARCPTTGKRRFHDHAQAVRELQRLQRKGSGPKGRGVVRVYDCPHCRGWLYLDRPHPLRRRSDRRATLATFGWALEQQPEDDRPRPYCPRCKEGPTEP